MSRMQSVIWKCTNCGRTNLVERNTSKRYLTCPKCGARYVVTGLHTNGTPFVRKIS